MRIKEDYWESAEQYRTVVAETMNLILKGNSLQYITNFLNDKYNLPIKYILDNFLLRVKKDISILVAKEAATIIPMHLELYEELYKYLDENGHSAGKMKALKYKEKLMGLHRENNVLEINKKKTTIIQKEVSYDVSRLTSDEVKRFNYLLEKAQKK